MSPVRGRPLFAVLVVAFVVVAALPVLFLSIQSYLWMTGDLLQGELDDDAMLARSLASGIDRYMSHRIHVVSVLAADVGATGLAANATIRRELDAFRRQNPMLSTVVVTDRTGLVVAAAPETDTTGKPNTGKRFDDRDWFQAAIAGAAPSYEMVISRGTSVGKPAMPIVAPIRSPRGDVIGVVAAGLNLDHLRRTLRDPDSGAGSDRVVVVDSRGQVILHHVRDFESTAHDLSRDRAWQAAQRETRGSVRYVPASASTPIFASYVRVPQTGWVVWVARDAEGWSGPNTSRLFRDLAVSALVAILIAAAVAVVVSRALSRPLRELVDAARQVGEGQFNPVAARPTSRIREFSSLVLSFGRMTEALQAQYEHLEGKVADRTRALEESAREARSTAALLRAQDEIRRGYAELAALLNSLDRSHILDEGTKKIAEAFHAPFAAVYLTDAGPEGLRLKTYTALDRSLVDASTLAADGVPREALRRGELIVVAPLPGSQVLSISTGAGTLDIAAVAAVPLAYQSRLLGVLVVALLEPPGAETRTFLDSAARQLSIALNNAGLFEAVRYQSQQLERLNVELKRASEVKSHFLASMSHELRTPLNSILGFTEVLLASSREPLSERQRTALGKVHGSGRHLLSLINDVLDLSKIEAGRMEVRPEPFTLAGLVAECLPVVEPQAQAKGLTLTASVADSVPAMVQDRGKLKQIVVNLLGNAVKFTERGSVELRIRPERNQCVAITIADTGRGIRAEDQAGIFEAFRQAADASATGGTGLGLAITRRLVGLLGGTITLDSEPNRGSVFTVIVPSIYDVGWGDGDRPEPPDSAARVLVIDDDRDVVDIIRRVTVDDGLAIEYAATAREGLARARSHPPAAIVLDVILQDSQDGWDVLTALKADDATRDIPVLIHSAIDNPDRARALGADAVVAKPATGGFSTTLRRLLRRPVPTASGAS